MNNFIKQNLVAIISLIIALFGGVPGFLHFLDFLKQRPKLDGELISVISGLYDGIPFVFMAVTLVNKGKTPIFPAWFDLEAKSKGTWIKFERVEIPTDLQFPSQNQIILVEPEKILDLQKYEGPISIDNPLRGHLMFISRDLNLEELRLKKKSLFKLICIDNFKRRFTVKLIFAPKVDQDIYHPKHGIMFKKK